MTTTHSPARAQDLHVGRDATNERRSHAIPVRTRTGLRALIAATAILLGMTVSAAPAQAATIGNVYISFPKWLGNCPSGGSVKSIWATDGLQTWNWDAGDDLVYGKVYLNQVNTVRYTLLCMSWRGGYYQPGLETAFVPTRNGQTIWVGPAGSTRN